ncbi:hypothetical protein BAUCODRAFT_106861 [Baudoinia panamericana UAMH 10762]|uniref:RNase MRP protein 1 RNA binding domain-containing protein n=1 Tax=Baudoinia panamericana (strain UAMH 10762) TaxID=717646 RepID=M2NEK6_BAUPA|nr:uncharacterized protein BAUCODRAFT_106861 [Baudoinia panamericana UAMH 10762]EMC97400.1 hypothetical protein BAUCODRAFT_106861 [Baudoinia panamericana UAMH 10762]
MARRWAADLSSADAERIDHIANILHLFHHRNKNQHRRSVWWRHFSLFRKQLNLVRLDVENLTEMPKTHVDKRRKNYWSEALVPIWQRAFSQLTAEGRFAVLGLALMSTLAEACHIFHITAAFESIGQQEVEKVLEKFANEDWERSESEAVGSPRPMMEDVGEVIGREVVPLDPIATKFEATATLGHRVVGTPGQRLTPISNDAVKIRRTHATMKPKSRARNAIDDLFSELG